MRKTGISRNHFSIVPFNMNVIIVSHQWFETQSNSSDCCSFQVFEWNIAPSDSISFLDKYNSWILLIPTDEYFATCDPIPFPGFSCNDCDLLTVSNKNFAPFDPISSHDNSFNFFNCSLGINILLSLIQYDFLISIVIAMIVIVWILLICTSTLMIQFHFQVNKSLAMFMIAWSLLTSILLLLIDCFC